MFTNRLTAAGRRGWYLSVLLLLIGSVPEVGIPEATAQPYRYWQDTTLPVERVPKRMQAEEMPIGLFVYNTTAISDIWTYATILGYDFLYYSVEKTAGRWSNYQTLLDSAPSGKHVIPMIYYVGHNNLPSYLEEASRSREVIFYPFDSSQMRDFASSKFVKDNVFTFWSYDTLQQNGSYRFREDRDWHYSEAIYDTGMANQVVASGLAFGYYPTQPGRYERIYDPLSDTWSDVDSAINSRDVFLKPTDYPYLNGGKWDGQSRFVTHRYPHFITVRGHLFANDSGTMASNDPILRINVWYEVSEGQTYYDSSGVLRTADTNLRFLYKSVDYTKGEFAPTDPFDPDYLEYHESSRKVNFRREGMGGPTDTLVTAQDIDLEVIYLGGEKFAVHSIAIRDSIYDLLVSSGSAGDVYRQKIIREADTLVRHPANWDSLRQSIYNLYLTDEPSTEQTAGFRETKKLIQNTFVYPGNDTLSSGNGDARPHLQHIGDAEWFVGLHYFEGTTPIDIPPSMMGLQYNNIPSIGEHNGGRFGIPELLRLDSLEDAGYRVTVADRIAEYNAVLQILFFGAHNTESPSPGYQTGWWPFTVTKVHGLARQAEQARRLGRRRLATIGPTSSLRIDYDPGSGTRDTSARHRPEPAEIRALVGIELAYGAKMFSTYALEASPWMDTADDGGPVGFSITMGIAPRNLFDTTKNIVDWTLYRRGTTDSLGVIDDYYLGFESIPRTLRQINAWLKRLAPTITRLRWRDGYSMHWQQRRPGVDEDNDRTPRPLPSAEIIASLRARHPITGAVDSAWTTYVEVGMFETHTDTLIGSHDPIRDTNWLVICNRRGFSTENFDQDELGYSNTARAVLDTLSETRTLRIDFTLRNPDTTQYTFIRVREVEPYVDTLPLLGVRHALDTIIHGDSAVELTLGAGQAALLEITYKPGDASIVDGELWWSNQR